MKNIDKSDALSYDESSYLGLKNGMNRYIADVMNAYEKREEINKKADEELKAKFSVVFFNIRELKP